MNLISINFSCGSPVLVKQSFHILLNLAFPASGASSRSGSMGERWEKRVCRSMLVLMCCSLPSPGGSNWSMSRFVSPADRCIRKLAAASARVFAFPKLDPLLGYGDRLAWIQKRWSLEIGDLLRLLQTCAPAG